MYQKLKSLSKIGKVDLETTRCFDKRAFTGATGTKLIFKEF